MYNNDGLDDLMKLGFKLNEVYVDYAVLSFIAKDLSKSKQFQRSFLIHFYKFVNTFTELDSSLSIPRFEDFKRVLEVNLVLNKLPIEVIKQLLEFKEIKASSNVRGYEHLFQNAYIYSIANTYRTQIVNNYMRATSNNDTRDATSMLITGGLYKGKSIFKDSRYVSNFTDDEYFEYINTSHPLIAKYVAINHKLRMKRILVVFGYLVNWDLDEN